MTWRPQKDAVRAGNANATGGKAASDVEPKDLKLFLEPRDSVWALRAFNVETDRQPYLVIGTADDLEPMVKGDVLDWAGKKLVVEAKPKVYRPGDGYDSAELIVTDHTTGGRS